MLTLVVSSCATSAPENPTPSSAPSAPPPISEIWHARCGACHEYVHPGERTRDELVAAFSRHRKKRVHLSDEQWQAMVDFLAKP